MNENRSGLCTASLVLGIISIVTCALGFLPGVLGLIFAIVCLAKKKQPKGVAVGGLITSIIGLLVGGIATIVAVIFIVTSGILVGGTVGVLSSAMDELANGDIDSEEFINIINNLDEANDNGGYNVDDYSSLFDDDGNYTVDDDDFQDYLSIFDGTEYEDWFSYNEDGGFDINVPSGTGEHAMYSGYTYFEDLEQYGYEYSRGDSTYSVYTNENGAEFEFPAYVYNYKDFGSTHFEAYDNYITKLGVKDYPEDWGFYYDEKLYDDISDEWEYAYADRITDYGDYQDYEIWLFAFNDVYDDMVILVFRPKDATDTSTFDKDFDDFIKTMKYMHPQ